MLAGVAKGQANLTRAIAVLDDPEAIQPLAVELAGLAERKRRLLAELSAVAEQRRQRETLRERYAGAQAWLATIAARVRGLSFADRRLALDALGVSVTVYPPGETPRYVIAASVPVPDATPLVSNYEQRMPDVRPA
jgi:hypothetical protein